jgi:phosphoribosyl-dephospho-CoA transferase
MRSLTISTVQPHDLVRLSDVGGIALGDAPPWVRAALSTIPWVVGRRSPATPELLAVGVRGNSRALRHAMDVARRHIDKIVRPEELVGREPPRDMPVFRTLTWLRSRIDPSELRWGPAGSVGFELATGAATVTENSDLDLIVRVDSLSPARIDQLTSLQAEFGSAEVRIDCQIQLPAGAVALNELVGSSSQILLRCDTGARLASRRELVA